MEVAEWEAGGTVNVKMSVSREGTLRGLHYQADPFAQAKIIRVCSGSILDVAVDLATGDLFEARLTASDPSSLFIPAGFAHGFLAEADDTAVVYLSTNRFDAVSERAYSPLLTGHPTFDWGRDESNLVLSKKDRAASPLEIGPAARHFRFIDGTWQSVSRS
jgi:dTDP-4-dehydrorhamnose 3,5-epimerase